MNPKPQPSQPSSPAQRPEARPASGSASEDAFDAPPIAAEEAAEGPDVSDQPGAEVGHYGMGYGDPTRHQGGQPPGADTDIKPGVPGGTGATGRPPPGQGGQQ